MTCITAQRVLPSNHTNHRVTCQHHDYGFTFSFKHFDMLFHHVGQFGFDPIWRKQTILNTINLAANASPNQGGTLLRLWDGQLLRLRFCHQRGR
ncbi:Uncharacterised protein [Vibrio cholerae]|uniref:Uncharacterized protein n=1 Tax=Vibrio cholerae TaxID=666 RepID=A0A655QH81_VIBCL|nr:Uncharacterised protein [Vibrio cholerae]CSA54498.1 Uncharacterised protein [Vibrio cholerae]CSB44553.1 Uncharacterised protein [Vibrio cholerae]CSB51344.1 Uncharacterised protein [Vibrio cholerae]CSB58941.1 Uncharacterised protein [Vibrio cholerae]